MEILLDSRRFIGHKTRTLFLTLDTGRTVAFKITAYAKEGFFVDPDRLNFAKVKRGSTPSQSIYFADHPGVRVTNLQCDSKYVLPKVVEFQRGEIGVVYEISASLRPDAPAGKWETDIWISTNDTDWPRIRVPVTVEVEPQAATR